MMGATEAARHAEEKGTILKALKEEYARGMTSVRSLFSALDLVGRRMTPKGLQFALAYLADQEYIRIWRAEEVPGFRKDRMTDANVQTIVFARLTAKGLHLIDGRIDADPGVNF
jgi:hypothetical protein